MCNSFTTKLNLLCWNAQSIFNKQLEFFDYLVKKNIHVAIVSETWLKPCKSFFHKNYYCYRNDRRDEEHGGVAIVIQRNIKHKLLESINTKVIESIPISIETQTGPITIVGAYFSNSKRDPMTYNLFQQDIQKLTAFKGSFIISGDLNSRHRFWNCFRGNKPGTILFNEMSNKNFNILYPHSPTYFPTQARYVHPSTIDIIISNGLHDISNIITSNELFSDHLPIEFNVTTSIVIHKTNYSCFNYSNANWYGFRSYLNKKINLLQLQLNTTDSIETSINDFTNILINAEKLAVPTKNKPNSKTVELSDEIKKLIKVRNLHRRRWQRTNDPNTKKLCQSINRDIQDKIFIVKNRYFNKKLHGLDFASKQFWRATKLIKNKSNKIPPLKNIDNDTFIFTDAEKAECIAKVFSKSHLMTEHFSDVATTDQVRHSCIFVNSSQISKNDISDQLIKPIEVKNILKTFKNRKSPGEDKINNILLKNIPKKGVVLLTRIFNACLLLSYFPNVWKCAKVIALPKPNKDATQPSNYRPISLLSCISKLFEKTILARINSFIRDNGVLPNTQFGFRAGHSTTHQLFRVSNIIKNSLNNKCSTGMVLLDVEKAFDTVWHDGLIHKLFSLNFPLYLIKLIHSFLSDRSFFVSVNSVSSISHFIRAGVPQGSSLSPVLFNLFTADISLPNNKVEIAMFADDIALLSSNIDPNIIISCLEYSLRQIISFYHKWKIKINFGKTQGIFFTRRRAARYLPNREIIFNNTNIQWLSEVKYLGLFLDKKLLFEKHISHSVQRIHKYIKILYPLINRKSKLSIKNKLLIYKTIFQPIMLYASPVWDCTADCHIKKLQIIQNKCLKIILNYPYYYNTSRLHAHANINLIKTILPRFRNNFVARLDMTDNPLICNMHPSDVRP